MEPTKKKINCTFLTTDGKKFTAKPEIFNQFKGIKDLLGDVEGNTIESGCDSFVFKAVLSFVTVFLNDTNPDKEYLTTKLKQVKNINKIKCCTKKGWNFIRSIPEAYVTIYKRMIVFPENTPKDPKFLESLEPVKKMYEFAKNIINIMDFYDCSDVKGYVEALTYSEHGLYHSVVPFTDYIAEYIMGTGNITIIEDEIIKYFLLKRFTMKCKYISKETFLPPLYETLPPQALKLYLTSCYKEEEVNVKCKLDYEKMLYKYYGDTIVYHLLDRETGREISNETPVSSESSSSHEKIPSPRSGNSSPRSGNSSPRRNKQKKSTYYSYYEKTPVEKSPADKALTFGKIVEKLCVKDEDPDEDSDEDPDEDLDENLDEDLDEGEETDDEQENDEETDDFTTTKYSNFTN